MTELEPLLKRIEQLTPYFGRARDDLTALLAIHRGEIDEPRVRRVLAMLESALGQSDLLPGFEVALEESEK